MFCRHCGQENRENSWKCIQCGMTLEQGLPRVPTYLIPNYLVPAILATLFCCMPLGVVAIVFDAQVNGFAASGNIAAAQDASAKALKWCWLSFWLGLVPVVIWLFVVLIAAVAGA